MLLSSQNGNVEYKHQVHNCTAARLEKLKTQMSYRMDEGNGCCVYRIGVEDDGCHSLLDYEACAETAKVLECLARSLNSVVLERKMIQNEVHRNEMGAPQKAKGDPVAIMEPSLLGDGKDQFHRYEDHYEHQREEKSTDESVTEQPQLIKDPGVYTRAELTIQRVETHLLDPSPPSIVALSSTTTKTSITRPKQVGENMSVAETLSSRNIRVAVVGNVDAGKSTMIVSLPSQNIRR